MSYTKQTWASGDVVTAEKLNHIESGIESAAELPAVSAADNGDVLTVVEGVWGKAAPSGGGGGGGAFYVTFNGDNPVGNEGEYTNVVADHTLEEAVAAYNAGQPVIFRMGGETDGETWTWGDALAYDDGGILSATLVVVYGSGETSLSIQATTYILTEDGPEMQLVSRRIETL